MLQQRPDFCRKNGMWIQAQTELTPEIIAPAIGLALSWIVGIAAILHMAKNAMLYDAGKKG